jgi:alpha-L-rhamnosidase
VSWQVRIRGGSGWSDWSAAHEFETGLLDLADWLGRFIGTAIPGPPQPRGQRGALYLRRRFAIGEPPARARVYATAHGIYELRLDGTRVGDLEVTPGFTACRSHLEVQAYDITALCGPGEHELVATVTDGWPPGAGGARHLDQVPGTSLALLAQVEITDQAGGRWDFATGAGWEATTCGPISVVGLTEGERTGQAVPPSPQDGWQDAAVLGVPDARLTVSPGPATGQLGQYRPVKVRLDADRQRSELRADTGGIVP